MISLRNRGQYSQAIREEFEHFADRIGGFLSKIFDQDGNIINEETVSVLARPIYYNDLSIQAGENVGYSVLPFAVDMDKTEIINNGWTATASGIRIRLINSTTIQGVRDSVSGDAVVDYLVKVYR